MQLSARNVKFANQWIWSVSFKNTGYHCPPYSTGQSFSIPARNKQTKNQEQQQQNICVEICVFVLLIGGHSKYFIQYFHMHKYTP